MEAPTSRLGLQPKRSKLDGMRRVFRYRNFYIMLLPAIAYYIIFHYYPMYGATIAFKQFSIAKGIHGSPWVGLKHFEMLLHLDKFWEVFWNTIIISLYRLFFGFPLPLFIALLLNEVRRLLFKRTVQTIIYLPHFISWVIMGGLLINMLATDNGIVNQLIRSLGGSSIGFLSDEAYFRSTLVGSMIWKEFGWNTIIYMAALAGVNPSLYEAAWMDGANRMQRIWHVTLPCIRTTIIILFILRIGSLMEAGFEQIFVLYHPGVYRVADIIDTYVYRTGLADGKFSLAAALGLFKSVINFVLLIIANQLARWKGDQGIF
ncbi:ABC transporter permease [Paenibacillus sp. GCM10027626]|uniref:ABC transporter permease n=1 Tax=Paenibacillus sp. GCM10027626 TaxID=3273411 RepID=UPI00363C9103